MIRISRSKRSKSSNSSSNSGMSRISRMSRRSRISVKEINNIIIRNNVNRDEDKKEIKSIDEHTRK